MRYLTFDGANRSQYKICILVNEIRRDDIRRSYVTPYGLREDEIIVIDLHQRPGKKKTPVAEIRAYITDELIPVLNELKVEYLIVGDGEYFKILTATGKVDAALGYVKETEYGPWKVVYVPNYRTVFYDPVKVNQKIDIGITALQNHMQGAYNDPGNNIIKFAAYPMTAVEIEDWLDRLLQMDCPLTVDIEAFSLKHYQAGIGTIGFAWSKHEGIAFPVDILGDKEHAEEVRHMLYDFFWKFRNKLIYHGISYDAYVLIAQLFMDDLLDNRGLLHGLHVMTRNWDCTKLISYLATNSCAGNKLGLKDQAQEFAGDYAQSEISDITKIPLPELLQYNLVDCLATWYVHEKHYDRMVRDQQLEIYETIFKPAIADIIQMQLTGMPVDIQQVKAVKHVLENIREEAETQIRSSPLVRQTENLMAHQWAEKRNQELKTKRVGPNDFKERFNPSSGPQQIKLLYEVMGLPVLDRTDTNLPATGGETLAKLINHTEDPQYKEILRSLIDYKAVEKILSSFIPALEHAQQGPDGWHWLFGFFNLGGTVSGRLSSNGPNLQNLPANVYMKLSQVLFEKWQGFLAPYFKDGKLSLGKLIKSCFVAPPGWFFCGIDFSSLEDRISALTTKDPNKLKVYTDGYDGHSLRAHAYFGDQMPDIEETVESINLIPDKYPDLRQESKTPTFLLTYGGTYIGIINQLGWPEAKAKAVEARYHELYKVSDEWVATKLNQACVDGYVTAAFGLRVRTPLLAQTIRGTSRTPYQAEAEGRTAGNALGQSWCLLNSRAGSEFMQKVREHPELKHAIKPCAQIHDANYVLVRDNIDAIHFANTHLVEACEWQDHPDIWHDEVKLGGEFSIFYPSWANEIGLPNQAEPEQILKVFEVGIHKLQAKQQTERKVG